ncbi:MAG TPA: NAD(P)H:quinone oxidoreductase [Flavobacterium sp.]|jgi:NAD(P)H dehydrogenase (quinone)
MSQIKLAIIYYSATGANHQMAQWAAEGARGTGAEVRLLRLQETAPESAVSANPAWDKNLQATKDVQVAAIDDLEWADAIIFSVPTRYGNMPVQAKQFFDMTGGLWFQGKLANKVVSAMTSAMNVHGGQEATLLSLYTTFYHWGAIVAAPGYTDPAIFASGGNPYGASATADGEGNIQNAEQLQPAVMHQARRTVQVAGWVKQGMTNQQ